MRRASFYFFSAASLLLLTFLKNFSIAENKLNAFFVVDVFSCFGFSFAIIVSFT